MNRTTWIFWWGTIALGLAVSAGAQPSESPPRPARVAVIATGPVGELAAVALRSGAEVPAAVVEAPDVETAHARTDARFVVTGDAVWDMEREASHPLPSKDEPLLKALAVAAEVARAQGSELSTPAKESLANQFDVPQAALASWAEARSANRARRYPEAARSARAALEATSDFALARAELAMSLASSGDHRQALEEARRAAEEQPAAATAHLAVAKALDYAGKAAEAAKAYAEVLDRAPYEYAALNNLGLIRLNTEFDYTGAVELFERARYVEPTSPAAAVNLGRAYLGLGRTERAIELLREARTRRPEHPGIAAFLIEALAKAGKIAPGRAVLEEVTGEGEPPAVLLVAQAQLSLAEGEPGAAVEVLERALEADPEDTAALDRLGRAREALGEWEAAREAYRRAIEAAPRRARYARRDLAGMELSRGDPDAARKLLEETLQFHPEDAQSAYNLGVVLLAQDELAGAEEKFAEAFEGAPHMTVAAYNLGVVRSRRGDHAGAVEPLQSAVEGDDGDPRFRLALGVALVHTGDLERALPHLGEAAKKAKGELAGEAHCAYGLALHARGDAEGARSSLERCRDHAEGDRRDYVESLL